MPNIKSKKKDQRRIKKRTIANKAAISNLRTVVKKAKTATGEEAVELNKKAVSVIDKNAKKGIIKKNTAARYKSRIAKAQKKSK